MKYAYLKDIGKSEDPVSILHGLQDFVHPSTRGHTEEAYRATKPLTEIEQGLVDGEKGFDTYCHGMAYFGKRALIANDIPRSNVRARVVYIDRPQFDRYAVHTVLEIKDGDKWKLLDPGQPERDFRMEKVEEIRDWFRPWEVSYTGGLILDPMNATFDDRELPGYLQVTRDSGILEREYIALPRIVASDAITAARDPYYPWDLTVEYERKPLFFLSPGINPSNGKEMLIVGTADVYGQNLDDLASGETERIRKVVKRSGIHLVPRDPNKPFL